MKLEENQLGTENLNLELIFLYLNTSRKVILQNFTIPKFYGNNKRGAMRVKQYDHAVHIKSYITVYRIKNFPR